MDWIEEEDTDLWLLGREFNRLEFSVVIISFFQFLHTTTVQFHFLGLVASFLFRAFKWAEQKEWTERSQRGRRPVPADEVITYAYFELNN